MTTKLNVWGRWILCLLLWVGCVALQPEGSNQAAKSPVSYQHIVRKNPNYSIMVVTMNLSDPRVAVHVARGGPDPDGDGPWVTTLMLTSAIARRENYDIAINGDFFTASFSKDIEGSNTDFVKGKFAAPVGPAMTGGQLWHKAATARPYLEITANHTAKLVDGRPKDPIDSAAQEIIGGGQIIVRAGKAVPFSGLFASTRNPRTVVGLDKTGTRLTLLVVDGRQSKLSIGMTLAELSTEMLQLGCENALNLDGGGSTTLVYRTSATKALHVINSPSDGKERAVADILGITVHADLPEAN